MKKLLVDIWNCLFDCYLTVRNSLYLFMDIPYRKVVIAPHVVSIEENPSDTSSNRIVRSAV